jgi:hypothetical protein
MKVGRTSRAGSGGAWRAIQIDETTRHIWHYAAHMATLSTLDGVAVLEQVSAGRGSVSDKAGMRRMVKALNA